MIKNNRCNLLGLCQGLGPDACPDCDTFECEVALPLGEAPRPAFPFAPGVIQGPELPIVYMDGDGPWFPLSAKATLKLLGTMVALAMLAGYLVERFT